MEMMIVNFLPSMIRLRLFHFDSKKQTENKSVKRDETLRPRHSKIRKQSRVCGNDPVCHITAICSNQQKYHQREEKSESKELDEHERKGENLESLMRSTIKLEKASDGGAF